jgi:hypothetical protein
MSEDPANKLCDHSNGKLDELFQIIQAMRSELSELKQTVDARLYDMRPIWEKVQADISQLHAGQTSLTARLLPAIIPRSYSSLLVTRPSLHLYFTCFHKSA